MPVNSIGSVQGTHPINSDNQGNVSVNQKSVTEIAKQLISNVRSLASCIAAKPRNVEFIDKGVTVLSQGIQKSKEELNKLGGYFKGKFRDINEGISKGLDNASSAIGSTADKVKQKLGEARDNLKSHFENARASVTDMGKKIRSLFEKIPEGNRAYIKSLESFYGVLSKKMESSLNSNNSEKVEQLGQVRLQVALLLEGAKNPGTMDDKKLQEIGNALKFSEGKLSLEDKKEVDQCVSLTLGFILEFLKRNSKASQPDVSKTPTSPLNTEKSLEQEINDVRSNLKHVEQNSPKVYKNLFSDAIQEQHSKVIGKDTGERLEELNKAQDDKFKSFFNAEKERIQKNRDDASGASTIRAFENAENDESSPIGNMVKRANDPKNNKEWNDFEQDWGDNDGWTADLEAEFYNSLAELGINVVPDSSEASGSK